MEAACTNPARLGGGSVALYSYPSTGTSYPSTGTHAWVTGGAAINTPFVTVPGLLTAQCVSNDKGSYLEVTVNGDPRDPRADDIPGDVMAGGKPNPSWGLHLIDVHAAMGDLVALAGKQATAYTSKAKSR